MYVGLKLIQLEDPINDLIRKLLFMSFFPHANKSFQRLCT